LRRALVALTAASSVAAVAPSIASATPQAFGTFTPASLAAGGHPDITAAGTVDTTAGAPQSVTIQLPPGLLASAAANPSCLSGTPQTTGNACLAGTGTLHTTGLGDIPGNAYLVPPPVSGDVAGIALVAGSASLPGEVKITGSGAGLSMQLLVNVAALSGAGLTGIDVHVNGTMNGQPLTRMPTTCAPLKATLIVQYAASTQNTDSPPFTPDCSGLIKYAPVLTGSATKDASDNGVTVVTDIAQGPGQAATQAATLSVPSTVLQPNTGALGLICTSATFTGCTSVGSASAASPLLPAPLAGTVYITQPAGGGLALTIAFPAPFAFNLVGTLDLANNATKFAGLPDVPLSDLKVTLSGAPHNAFQTSCQATSGTLTGSFTAQSTATANSNPTLTLTGCPAGGGGGGGGGGGTTAGAPTIGGGSLSGLGSGKASLKFKLTAGTNAPKLKSFKVKLPSGLSFIKKGLAKGVKVSGGGKSTVKLSGGALVVTEKTAGASLSASFSSKALSVSKSLAKKAKKHKIKSIKVTVTVTDSAGLVTTLTLTIKNPS
jgi:hypothetical protein